MYIQNDSNNRNTAPSRLFFNTPLCSGFGQWHTDNPLSPKPKPYITINFNDVLSMVESPPSVAKETAKWVIPSALITREAAKQRANGTYYAVWCDFDNHTELQAIKDILASLVCFHVIYSSRSATATKQKWRVIIPLATPANATDWQQIAQIINDKFEAAGIVPDRASERISQICYLPNKGEFYQFHIASDHAPLNWQAVLSTEIIAKQNQAKAEQLRLDQLKESSRLKAVERMATGALSPIDAYNAAYSLEQSLEVYGYKRIGKKYLSPNAQSGAAGVSVKGDKWLSMHGSDAGIGHPNREGGGCHGDAFDLFIYYEHGGNRNAAIKAAGAMFTTANGSTLSKANQRAFMEQNSTANNSSHSSFKPDHREPNKKTPLNFAGHTNNDLSYLDNCPDFPEPDYSTMPHGYDVNADYDDMAGIPTPFDKPAPIGTDTLNYEGDIVTSSQPDTMPTTQPKTDKPAFTLGSFSLRGQSESMRAKMLNDTFVMDRIAILGQATVIYAKPNTGKTALSLWLIIQSIKSHRIKGENVFYINADDDYKGIVFKTKLAERYGFEMLAPSHNGFEAKALMGYMRQMIDEDAARGKVIILDTLKKFTDLMNKKTGSEFMNRAREFVASGGTLIMLAHTNKNRDMDGKAVFGGTSDIVDDCDCAFILDEISVNGTVKQVLFENIKSRGDVARELAFSYSITEKQSYSELMDSIEVVDGASVEQAKKDKAINAKREKDKPAINAITETIEQGINLKTELIETASKSAGISKRILTAALDDYNGQLWRESIGARNAKSYHLIPIFEATEYTYGFAKNGN